MTYFIETFVDSKDFRSTLTFFAQNVFEANGLGSTAQVRVSDRPDLADFQCNEALIIAKQIQRVPRDIAELVRPYFLTDARMKAVEVAGPGFLNFVLSESILSKRINALRNDLRFGAAKVAVKRKVIIDFGGPNVAKPMHVGHLRTAVIGESLKRIFRFMGDEVVGDAHFGDWGYQMGLLITAVHDEQPNLPYFEEELEKRDIPTVDLEFSDFITRLKCVDSIHESEISIAQNNILKSFYWKHCYNKVEQAEPKNNNYFPQRGKGGRLLKKIAGNGLIYYWEYPSNSPVSLEDLERLYPEASLKGKENAHYREKARRATKELQSGRRGYLELWKHFVNVSRKALIRDYAALNVTFDWWKGESDADPYIEPMVRELTSKGLLEFDQGAQIIRVARDSDKAEIPPMLVVSSEGSAMYGTTDLATIKQRQVEFDPDLILYVVDQRQANHFTQVFRAAYLAGYAQEGQLEHAANGTVNGPDGTPFKTRDGGTLKLHDLISQAVEKATLRLHEAGLGEGLSEAEFADTAHKVAVAALKFAELSNHRLTNYIFDLDRFMSFEGKTGPYLLYQAVRMKSILRKAADQGVSEGAITVGEPAERELVLLLDAFDNALKETYIKRAPNLLADHVYRLAQGFSKFYANCPVLVGDDGGVKASRLGLVTLTLKQLELGLDLMGLSAPEQM